MKDGILISVIMPTLNAENIIEDTLKTIRNQSIDKNKIEILIIDGGSTDKTREIAKKYDAKIFENKEVVPESAKKVGMMNAKGKYICFIDSDERLTDIYQFEKRIDFFNNNPEIKAFIPNTTYPPENSPDLATYFVVCGDPFTYFVYRKYMVDALKKSGRFVKTAGGHVIKFEEDDILPLADAGGTMVDWDYAYEHFADEIGTQQFVSTFFDRIVRKSQCIGIIDDDKVVHHVATNKKSFFKKLKFRVINNIHYVEGSGYAARAVVTKKLSRRKYLFLLYCLTIVWPFIDSIILSLRHNKKGLMMHFIYTYYVFFQIIGQYTLKFLKKNPKVRACGK